MMKKEMKSKRECLKKEVRRIFQNSTSIGIQDKFDKLKNFRGLKQKRKRKASFLICLASKKALMKSRRKNKKVKLLEINL